MNPKAKPARGRPAALLVAAGIFLSRLAGLVRDRAFAHYFGNSAAADAFRAALRIPNFLQNLFGEGVLSASFIPVYAGLVAKGDEEEADRVASVVLTMLGLLTSGLVLIGVTATPYLVEAIAPGFSGSKRGLTIQLVRILFPGTGLLVLSAWCLGILNSHRKFFLSYAAPVIWNVAIIAALIGFGGKVNQDRLAVVAAWGSVIGCALQFGVQLPMVLRLLGDLRPSLDYARESAHTVLRNFGPVFVSRGVVQISAYIDSLLASLLPTGAVAALSYAQTLYTLPVSLFGMSVSASELTAMSRTVGNEAEIATKLRERLNTGLRQIAFFVAPSAMAFLALGDVIAAAIYRSGKFTQADAVYVWAILAGSAVGLLASTLGRLYSSTYYALKDTRTPLRYAMLRVLLTTALGYVCAIPLPAWLGVQQKWGVAGLTASAGIAGWIEFVLLRRGMNRRIGTTGVPADYTARLWAAAAAAAAVGWLVKLVFGQRHAILLAGAALAAYGFEYLALTMLWGIPEARGALRRVLR